MSQSLAQPPMWQHPVDPTRYFDSTLRLLNFCSQVGCFNPQFMQEILPYFSSKLSTSQSNAMLAFAIDLSSKLAPKQLENFKLQSNFVNANLAQAQLESLAQAYAQTPRAELATPASLKPYHLGNTGSWNLPLLALHTINAQLCETRFLNDTTQHNSYGYLVTEQGQQIPGFFIEALDVEASAGPGSYSHDYVSISRAFVSEYEYSQYLGHENPAHLKVLRITGDSMERTLKSGQTCMVRLVNGFEQAGIYVFTYDGVTYIKRLTRCQDHYIASSINTKYEPFTVEEELLIIHAKLILSLEYKAL